MTMFDNEIDRMFQRMSRAFGDDILGELRGSTAGQGPYFYGYTMTVGPDGRPVIKEYGNARPGRLQDSDAREPVVDTIVDEKEGVVKLIAEMPGVEKTDVKILVDSKVVDVSAKRGEKAYRARVPLRHKVDENSAKASYKNGILELAFKLAEEEPTGKVVEVE